MVFGIVACANRVGRVCAGHPDACARTVQLKDVGEMMANPAMAQQMEAMVGNMSQEQLDSMVPPSTIHSFLAAVTLRHTSQQRHPKTGCLGLLAAASGRRPRMSPLLTQ